MAFLIVQLMPRNWPRAIVRLVSDDALRHRLGERCRRKVLERYDPARYARQVEGIYREVLGCARPGSRAVSDLAIESPCKVSE